MGVKLDRLIRAAVQDNKVTRAEVEAFAKEANANGALSKTEKKQLQKLLDQSGSSFDADAKNALQALLGGTPPVVTGDASTAMKTALAAAAQGGVNATELSAAEAAVAAKFGTGAAKQALIESLGINPQSLTLDAAGWLQGKYGQMEGHVSRYQAVLGDALKGAKLVDANFDGKLDANDLVFKADAAGKIDVQKVGEAMRDKVKIAAAVVGACEAAASSGNQFVDVTPSGWKNELPSAFFTDGWSGGGGELKPGVKPSDALNALLAGGSKYECGTAMKVVYYKAILDLIGPKDFDRVCANMTINPGYGTGMVPQYTETGSTGSASPTGGNPLSPGDRGYITNWDVSPQGRTAGWSGENVVYLGDGKYYGHPFGVETAEHMIAYMGGHRNPGSTRPASHSSMLGGLGAGILAEDKEIG